MPQVIDNNLLLNHIILNKSVNTVFQPIFNLSSQTILGYEALSRGPEHSPLKSPFELFKIAHETGLYNQIEEICFAKAIESFARQNLPGKLFLNVTPNFLVSELNQIEVVKQALRKFGLTGDRLVIEITEENPADNLDDLISCIENLRTLGINFAIDDLGAGYSGLIQWSKIRPNLIKIDKYFIRECNSDLMKREFIKSLLSLANKTNAMTIVEGVETEAELLCVRDLGINFVQGFLLAKPSKQPKTDMPYVMQSLNSESNLSRILPEETVAQLLKPCKGEHWDTRTKVILDRFKNDKNLYTIPILDGSTVVGIVMREKLMEFFSQPLGHALYDNKPISFLMDTSFIIAESSLPLENLSRILTDETRLEARTPFVITDKGKYLGMGSVRTLLKIITDAKIERAKYSNPLSQLPGNVPIDKEIDSLLAKKQNFYFAYLDLNHFKPFNDQYGYAKGDEIILLLSNLIKKVAINKYTFCGHIGGDDFVIIFYKNNWQSILNQILKEFELKVSEFFSDNHLKAKGYWGQSRDGQRLFYPLLSLSIGLITPDPEICLSHHHVSEYAMEAKKKAKSIPGNNLYVYQKKNTSPKDLQNSKFEIHLPSLLGSNYAEAIPLFPLEQQEKLQVN